MLHHTPRHHLGTTTTTTTTEARSVAPAPVLLVRKETQAVAPVIRHTAAAKDDHSNASDDHTQANDDHAQARDSQRDEHDTQAAGNDGEHGQSGKTLASAREHDTQEPADTAEPEHGKNQPEHSGDGGGVVPTTPNPDLTVTVPVAAGTPENSQPEPLPGAND
jgi:hypothetical protein